MDLQKRISAWQKATFGDHDSTYGIDNHLIREFKEMLEAIRATGTSGRLFFREVGSYRLSVIYRRSSAVAGWDFWYPESMIWLNGRIEYQGEGWTDFRLFHCLEAEDAVTAFLTPEPDED